MRVCVCERECECVCMLVCMCVIVIVSVHVRVCVQGILKGGSITLQVTSCLTGLESAI